ncbi:MAG: glycosyltransferase [Ruminococcus sp.]|nr:glycosyltransferase [Ruminococcus sp.]
MTHSNNSNTPTLSVVMPVYNTSEYLEQSIESVLNQTYTDYELLLIDDGSTDDSGSICDRYAEKDSRIVVIHKKNGGLGSVRNVGIETARGKYITFPDSDDHLHPEAYRKSIDVLENQSPDLVLFGFYNEFMNRDAESAIDNVVLPDSLTLDTAEQCRKYYAKYVFGGLMNQTWNKIYRKSILDEYHIRNQLLKRAQDAFFTGEYFRHVNSMITIPEPLYYYRTFGKQNFWNKYPKDAYLIDVKYNAFIKDMLEEFGEYDGESRTLADRWFYNSVLRDASYFRNPNWALDRREKIEYVTTVITDPYNQSRAQTAWAKEKKTKQIQKRILDRNAKGLMHDIKRFAAKDKYYHLYYRTLRRLTKKS